MYQTHPCSMTTQTGTIFFKTDKSDKFEKHRSLFVCYNSDI